jgi:hypothetical protein
MISLRHRFISLALLTLTTGMVVGCHSSQPAQPAAQTQPPSASGSAQPDAAPAGTPAAANAVPAAAPAPATPPPAATVELARGTHIRVRLSDDLGSKISQPGQVFHCTIADAVVVDGQTVIERGARAEGTVVDAKPLGRFKGGAELEVRLDRVHTKWGRYPVATTSIERAEKGKGQRSAGFIGGGAGLGALIGGIAGGGKGAAIGALAGGGAGTAGTALTGNQNIVLPAETLLTFRLEKPVHITQDN